MAKIPDKAEHQRQFVGLDLRQRRAIIKAVNRGKVVEDRRHAHLAVGVARRQARFWRVAWLLGPVVALTSLFSNNDMTVALLNAAVATVTLGAMSYFFFSRARRAETANLEAASSRRGRGRAGTSGQDGADANPSAGQRLRSHLPGGSKRSGSSGAADTTPGPVPERATGSGQAGTNAPLQGHRPYRPRGRKRR